MKLLRPDQLAERLNISRSAAYRLIAAGHFVTLKVGGCLRVSESSVDRYLKKQIQLYEIENGTLGIK